MQARPNPQPPDHLIRLGVVTYIFALTLIAAFTIAFHFLTDSIVHRQEATARVVNICGRQRMLSQRIARLALERASHASFRSDEQTNEALRSAIGLIASTHHSLLYGAPELGISGPSSNEVRNVYVAAPWTLDLRMQDFLAHAESLAAKPASQLTLADPDLAAIEQAAQAPLLDALNAAVTANQQTSENAISHLRGILGGLTLSMLVILLLEALFLYRPLFRRLARAHVELIEAGRTDPLTGCLNRRAFTIEAHSAVGSARENGRPLAVLMADIDRFKSINDRYGHAAGDRVINTVVSTLIATIQPGDVLCRMGGEEFAVMMPGGSITAAVRIAEMVRAAVAATTMTLDAELGNTIQCTISIGVAILEDADASLFDVLGRADKALYLAKTNGRNRVEWEAAEPYAMQKDELSNAERSRV